MERAVRRPRRRRARAGAAGPVAWRGGLQLPGTRRLLQLPPQKPDIVHAHNLHGDYFDLRALPWLSEQTPVVLTLHDAWLLSGHCAHAFACTRWETGCGQCPDLTIPPAIARDATAFNWRRKRRVYARSRLYVATPSRWLMDRVARSMLAPAIAEARVIPNGVDLTVFAPADRRAARAALGLPPDDTTLLFMAQPENPWKDHATLRAALPRIAERLRGAAVRFVALGMDAPAEQIGAAALTYAPFTRDPATLARYYQAADVYMHATKADTFPVPCWRRSRAARRSWRRQWAAPRSRSRKA
ncbi:MAG: glycosyltransferase [Anaerolineae bacterium]|nr:glycosyltransferase [Anaerolineae bacterium]